MPKSNQEILDDADELAKRFEDYEPQLDDERPVEEYLLERVALAGARGERQIVDAEIHEEPMPEFTGLNRLVRRNDDTVRAVLVNGKVAWQGDSPSDDLGAGRDYGRVLPLGSG